MEDSDKAKIMWYVLLPQVYFRGHADMQALFDDVFEEQHKKN